MSVTTSDTGPAAAAADVPTKGYVQAVNETLHALMAEDPDILYFGEDVALVGGGWGFTRGLMERFSERRCFDTPISEEGIVGLGVGAAIVGLRPIVDLMFMDFMAECMDELCNQMAKNRYMFGGRARMPVTVRMMSGCGVLAAAQHSQSLEAWICHTPGLKVVMPSNPYDAKGLHVAAVRDDNPVVIVETKTLIQMECPVPDGLYEVPIGVANVVKEGADFTVVAIGHLVGEAQRAAQTLLDEDGIDLEIVDPRSLQPLDVDTLVTSVAKTHRALVAHEAVRSYGAGAEIAAQIAEHAFDDLDAPVGRIGAPFAPVPFSPVLEAAYRPGADQIVAEVRRILRRS